MAPISVEVGQQPKTINVSTKPLKILPILEPTRIGIGGQGVVYKGHWKTTMVAVKFMALNNRSKQNIEKEIEALSKLEHPNICTLVGWYIRLVVPELLPFAALVTEFYSGGDLYCKVMNAQMSENAIMNIFRQLFDAVLYIHSKNMIHCDIKLENIVFTSDGTPMLIDFGLTNRCNAGTPFYTSPESSYMIHKGIDIWALGICLWACLTRSFPWSQAHIKCRGYKLVLALMESKHTSICDAICAVNQKECPFSLNVKHLLDSMLCVDHKNRCTIIDLQHAVSTTHTISCNSMKVECNEMNTDYEKVVKKRRHVY